MILKMLSNLLDGSAIAEFKGARLRKTKIFDIIVSSKGSEAYGAGNISIPVLVCTGLELISKLFVGNTSNATENVSKFIDEFFPAHGKKIPRIIWDGIRNGTNHNFSPN